ncbi:MAG: hypothetical protein WCG25_04355 [bacterium]
MRYQFHTIKLVVHILESDSKSNRSPYRTKLLSHTLYLAVVFFTILYLVHNISIYQILKDQSFIIFVSTYTFACGLLFAHVDVDQGTVVIISSFTLD